MSKESDFSIVMGSGKQGLEWACSRNTRCIALDKNSVDLISPATYRFIIGDSFYLPFRNNSINNIYSDFLLNAIQAGDCVASDVIDEPEILASNPYPQRVRGWYNDVLKRRFETELHLGRVRLLLREAAIVEMWRVLSVGGEITIVDHKHVVNWVINESPDILPTTNYIPVIFTSHIDYTDRARSGSLKKILQKGEVPKKIILQKSLSV